MNEQILNDTDNIPKVNDNEKVKASRRALKEVQEAMKGEAKRLGLRNINDVVKLIHEVRKELK